MRTVHNATDYDADIIAVSVAVDVANCFASCP